MYIGTGNFESVAYAIMKRHNITHLFEEKGIYGLRTDGLHLFPNGKVDLLREIKADYKHNQVMIVGDGNGDMSASVDGDNKFIAFGLSLNNLDHRQQLIENGADFIAPDLSNWEKIWRLLGLSTECEPIHPGLYAEVDIGESV